MAVAAMPAVLLALVSQSTAAIQAKIDADEIDRRVVRLGGIGPTDDPGPHFLDIGRNDPAVTDLFDPGQHGQTMATCGTARTRDEDGTINCVATSWNGDMDTEQAMADAFDTLEVVSAVLRSDPSLGITGYQQLSCEIQSVTPEFAPFDGGVDCAVVFTVHYTARI